MPVPVRAIPSPCSSLSSRRQVTTNRPTSADVRSRNRTVYGGSTSASTSRPSRRANGSNSNRRILARAPRQSHRLTDGAAITSSTAESVGTGSTIDAPVWRATRNEARDLIRGNRNFRRLETGDRPRIGRPREQCDRIAGGRDVRCNELLAAAPRASSARSSRGGSTPKRRSSVTATEST